MSWQLGISFIPFYFMSRRKKQHYCLVINHRRFIYHSMVKFFQQHNGSACNIEAWFVIRTAWKALEGSIVESEESSMSRWKIIVFFVSYDKDDEFLMFEMLNLRPYCLFRVSTTLKMNGKLRVFFFHTQSMRSVRHFSQEKFVGETNSTWNWKICKSFSLS